LAAFGKSLSVAPGDSTPVTRLLNHNALAGIKWRESHEHGRETIAGDRDLNADCARSCALP
jgi:hypothetical protein